MTRILTAFESPKLAAAAKWAMRAIEKEKAAAKRPAKPPVDLIADDVRVIGGAIVVDVGWKIESPHSRPRHQYARERQNTKQREDTRGHLVNLVKERLGYAQHRNGYLVELKGRVEHVGFIRFAPSQMASDNLLEAFHYYRDGAFDILAGIRLDENGRPGLNRHGGIEWMGHRLDDDQLVGAIEISYNQRKACGCAKKVRCRHEAKDRYGAQFVFRLKEGNGA